METQLRFITKQDKKEGRTVTDYSDSEFQGKVAVITGAGNGLGKSHAIEFAKRGAKL